MYILNDYHCLDEEKLSFFLLAFSYLSNVPSFLTSYHNSNKGLLSSSIILKHLPSSYPPDPWSWDSQVGGGMIRTQG
jgi:hypothetical protein